VCAHTTDFPRSPTFASLSAPRAHVFFLILLFIFFALQNTRETCQAVKGLTLKRAKAFLHDVINHKDCVPFRRFADDAGRTAQAKVRRTTDERMRASETTAIEWSDERRKQETQ
jgi:hypothetical protein